MKKNINETKTESERKPLLALAGSSIMPGLGQIYNGELTKGLSLFLIYAFTIPVFAWSGIRGPESFLSPIVFLGLSAFICIYLFSLRDAYCSAVRIGKRYELAIFNQAYVYLAILFFGYFFVLNQLIDFTKTRNIEAFNVPSESMIPNLLPGDHFFVDKRVNFIGAKNLIRRGDIATFVYPNDRTQLYLKRVIGLPGDKIEIRDMDVLVNGKSIRGEVIQDLGSKEMNRKLDDHFAFLERGDFGSYTVLWKKGVRQEPLTFLVPNGHVFVLADNRDHTQDSRSFGAIPLTDLNGKARQVWMSISPEFGIRWQRFGKILAIQP